MSLRYALLPILLCVGLTFYFFNLSETKPELSKTNAALIDERMEGVNAKQFDEHGNLTHSLAIESAFHYKGALDTAMTSPSLTLYQNDAVWTITAKKGTGLKSHIGGHFQQVDLMDEVNLDCASKTNKTWHLTTNTLQIYPEDKIAKTTSLVTLFGEGFTLEAQGMNAKMDKREVEFLSKVKSNYEFPKT